MPLKIARVQAHELSEDLDVSQRQLVAMHRDSALGLWKQTVKFQVHILALPPASCVTLQAFPHL